MLTDRPFGSLVRGDKPYRSEEPGPSPELKFVQIVTAVVDARGKGGDPGSRDMRFPFLYGLTEDGDVYEYYREAQGWTRLGMGVVSGSLKPVRREEANSEKEHVSQEALVADEGFPESLAKPIEELPLPARAINALKTAGVSVVADLVQKTDQDLESVKNLGSKSIEEIKIALAALGLSLGMHIDPNLLRALGNGGAMKTRDLERFEVTAEDEEVARNG